MQERLLDLILHIIKELTEKPSKEEELHVLSSELEKEGFSEYEIGLALSWVMENFHSEDDILPINIENAKSRVLSTFEKFYITEAVVGYIIQLKQLNILSNNDIEFVIDQLLEEENHHMELPEFKQFLSVAMIKFLPHQTKTKTILAKGTDTVQ